MYMVQSQFPKRTDSTNATCLVALAVGIVAYVRVTVRARYQRSTRPDSDAKISRETKTLVYTRFHNDTVCEYPFCVYCRCKQLVLIGKQGH